MSVIRNELLLATDDATGYNLTKSLRFRSSASAYLSRTPASAGNQKTWTWSGWFKNSTTATDNTFIDSFVDINNETVLRTSGNQISFAVWTSGAYTVLATTPAVFRDPAAWYHIVLALDTTQATNSNGVKVYVNGIQQTLTFTNYTQNANTLINTINSHRIGRNYISNSDRYTDGYFTEINFIDGQALTSSSFGETDATTGVWKPKSYTGTYGTNGFYLPFTDVATTSGSNAGLGKDFSGNGNYWNTNNISVTAGNTYDSMTDVPTLTSATAANYCVLNPLHPSIHSITNGNLSIYAGGSNSYAACTMQIPSNGKFYWEFTCQDTQTTLFRDPVGLVLAGQAQEYLGASNNSFSYCGFDGNIRGAGVTTPYIFSTWTNGDVVGMAVDANTGKVYISKNNVWQNSGDPAAGTGYVVTISNISSWLPAFGAVAGGSTYYINGAVNFGQRPFAYTPPTGYVALNSYNLPDSTIVAGNKVMDATTYTGNATSGTNIINAAGFKPDLVWIKNRTNSTNHIITDSVRGATNTIFSDLSNANTAVAEGMQAFNSNGFKVGFSAGSNIVNNSGNSYVGWQWKAGQGSTSSNTAGSITSTVSVNTSAGFSIVTYTGTGSNATIGHGLGVSPKFIAIKVTNNTYSWRNYHVSAGNTGYVYFNSADPYTASSTTFNNTSPTSSVFSVGTEANTNANGGTFVAYCWAEVDGFSKFGSYTGNGSADGTFVYTGFKPKFVMIKNIGGANDWNIRDTSRSKYNTVGEALYPNLSFAEYSGTETYVDLLSNGFKLRGNWASSNATGGNYIYIAFAENPFKNSLAR